VFAATAEQLGLNTYPLVVDAMDPAKMYEPVKYGLTNNRVRQVRAWGRGGWMGRELIMPAVSTAVRVNCRRRRAENRGQVAVGMACS
jgi:hypothetical protein